MRNADRLRLDDLVGQAVLEDAVLVDSGLVREGVAAHDRLIGLREAAGQVAQQLAGPVDLPGVHVAAE